MTSGSTNPARAIFIGGTGSNAGKSWMATAFCRLLARRGLRVAPFKAQNMSNNSFPCREGGEIGRSQVAQAEACGLEPSVAMNPVLLKPAGGSSCQVILHGKVWKTLHASEYYRHADFFRTASLEAYRTLAAQYEVIVMEGAGSVAELNLYGRDFTNLTMAHDAEARALLVADIEHGGVFAAILGTLQLLPPEHRALVRSFAVNRFRGDRSLFDDGVEILQRRSGLPCLGVFPYAREIHLDAEDSLASAAHSHPDHGAGIAIIRLPRISNTTDFRHMSAATWIERPVQRNFSVVILPGTKATLSDLDWLRATGLDTWIAGQHRTGATILGICGGYQMLGESIADPLGVDGAAQTRQGLGLLPVQTVMEPEKTTRTRQARSGAGNRFTAYEIHMGRTDVPSSLPPFATLEDGTAEGVDLGRVKGTYLHGALESPELVAELFGFQPGGSPKHAHYDALADWLETNATPAVLAGLLGAGA